MRIFVTGASGWVGSATVPELIAAGHDVIGLARSEQSAAAIEAAGARVHRGSLEDLDGLASAASAADGVIHLAFIHDFANFEASALVDRSAIEAFGNVLAGTGKPLVIASGTGAVSGAGGIRTERDGGDPNSAVAPRVLNEQIALSLAERGVRAAAVRLPPTVHGAGDHGFVPRLIDVARERGVAAYVGDGSNRWPAVHRSDAARVFRLAIEDAPAGSALHAVAEEGVEMREIARVFSEHLGVPTASISREDAGEHFGFLGAFVGADVPASSAITRELLGWSPSEIGLLADLEQGHYFEG